MSAIFKDTFPNSLLRVFDDFNSFQPTKKALHHISFDIDMSALALSFSRPSDERHLLDLIFIFNFIFQRLVKVLI